MDAPAVITGTEHTNHKIFKIRKIKMPESGESNADLRPYKNRRTTLQMPV